MKLVQIKNSKQDIRKEMHLTRPPRLEGVVKEAMMQPIRKRKRTREKPPRVREPQPRSRQQRKNYQLASKRYEPRTRS